MRQRPKNERPFATGVEFFGKVTRRLAERQSQERGQRGQVEVRHRDRLREAARGVSETGTDNDGEFNVNGVGLHFYTAIVVIVVVVIIFFFSFLFATSVAKEAQKQLKYGHT